LIAQVQAGVGNGHLLVDVDEGDAGAGVTWDSSWDMNVCCSSGSGAGIS
jgi:hypothetical protein